MTSMLSNIRNACVQKVKKCIEGRLTEKLMASSNPALVLTHGLGYIVSIVLACLLCSAIA